MFEDPMPGLEPQEYHTEPQLPQKPIQNDCHTQKKDENSKKSSIANQSNNESFSFEKNKIQSLNLVRNFQTDVNDESIQKLKDDIMQKFQEAIISYNSSKSLIKNIGLILICINVTEIIAAFFLLLIMSIEYIPSNQIMTIVCFGIVLCLFEIFSAIKIINSFQSKSLAEVKVLICHSKLFFAFFSIAFVILILMFYGLIFPPDNNLNEDQISKLDIINGIILFVSFSKLFGQIIFIVICNNIKAQLINLNGEVNTDANLVLA